MDSGRGSKKIFTIELTMLFIMLILVISIITEVLVMARGRSIEASRLNASVILASNTAETASMVYTMDELSEALAGMENTVGHNSRCLTETEETSRGIVWVIASLDPDDEKAHRFIIRVTRTYSDGGRYAGDKIDVFDTSLITGTDDFSTGAEGITAPENGSVDFAEEDDRSLYSLETGKYFGEVTEQ